jgi:fructose-bisphosphate aldolase, class II
MELKPGVVWGNDLSELWQDAKQNGYALPAVNVVTSSTVNAVLEAAAQWKKPIVIQISHGGAAFYSGGSISNEQHQASILGAVLMAQHVHRAAVAYGIPVVLNTDHCQRQNLPWLEGVILESEQHFANTGMPLFSMHMLDLSEEALEPNLDTTAEFLQRLNKIGSHLEMEIGITGGEEDAMDNTDTDHAKLYTTPEDVDAVYARLHPISEQFLIAAAFGNTHGVYAPGNVQLKPQILDDSQKFVTSKYQLQGENPINFVFHGGSGSSVTEIAEAVSYGVVKMNLDTDIQWAYWEGAHSYYNQNSVRMQSQLGDGQDPTAPNKKYYDPRKWLRAAEQSVVVKLTEYAKQLGLIS